MIDELIDKFDSFEIVRDQIAAILATEVANQMQLAIDAGKDPELWKLRIYSERSNPWEQFLNNQDDRSPIVNVWYDNANFDGAASNTVERQKSTSVYNIDCYGLGISLDDAGGGHEPGDKVAAFECHRAIRLVRNILMAAQYTYLGLRGLVWQRWPQSITVFQPELDARQMQKVVAGRIAFRVMFNEFSPQVLGEPLELVSVDVERASDGQILIQADYDYT